MQMQMNTTMSQGMHQKMYLAPRMIQSMEILQLPIMALQEKIEQELQENPVLELSDEPREGLTIARGHLYESLVTWADRL